MWRLSFIGKSGKTFWYNRAAWLCQGMVDTEDEADSASLEELYIARARVESAYAAAVITIKCTIYRVS
jgi:hypothetical protein